MKKSFGVGARHGGRTLCLTLVLGMLLAAVGASSAMATPKGEYSVFAQCPTSNETISGCVVARTESGEFTIGSENVPLSKTQTLQGGFITGEGGNLTLVAAKNGETLTKTPQKVPGGLLGLVKCNEIKGNGILEVIERGSCELLFENGTTGVNATTELAGPASSVTLNSDNLFFEKGTALTLPVKVKLENPLLGEECYIGSNSKPIVINLTSGTTEPPAPNKPIKGSKGEISSRAEGNILVIKNNELVNNSFAAPEASGCGGLFSFLIDPIVNSKLGLPSAAGHNTAILKGTTELAAVGPVRESEA
jgi:hypothetical protein